MATPTMAWMLGLGTPVLQVRRLIKCSPPICDLLCSSSTWTSFSASFFLVHP
jgi:hypothetical protein